ncbi:MAG: hypothetical protein ACYTDU_01270 [Planctomycetota bacterium]
MEGRAGRTGPDDAIRRAQELVAKYVRKGRRLSRELLEERRRQSRRR